MGFDSQVVVVVCVVSSESVQICGPSPSSNWSGISMASSCVVFKVEKLSVFSPKGLPLSDHYSRHNFLAELWLALLDSCKDHVANCCSGQTVQTATNASNSDDVQVLGPCVISTVDDGSDWETQRNAELSSCGTSTSSLRHLG